MTPRPLERVTVTIPADLRRAADRLARQLDRSRSWVIAEAVRRFAEAHAPAGKVVHETAEAPQWSDTARLAAAERRRLQLTLSLSAEERLRNAEELLQLHRALRPPTRRQQIVTFDSQEDFHRWKQAQQVAAAVPR